MVRICKRLLATGVLAIVLVSPVAARARTNEWTRVSGLTSEADLVVLSPDFASDHVMLACAGSYGEGTGPVMRSSDGGATWTRVGYDQGLRDVTALAFAPNTVAGSGVLVAGTEGGKILRSSDGGKTWLGVTSPVRIVWPGVDDVAFSPAYASDGTVFVSYGGYYGSWGESHFAYSHDGGQTWTDVTDPYEIGGVSPLVGGHIAVSPDFANDRSLVVVCGSVRDDRGDSPSVYRSTDGGLTWVGVAAGPPAEWVEYSPDFATDHLMLLVAPNQAIYRSTNAGQAWTRVFGPCSGRDRDSKPYFSPNWSSDHAVYIVIDGMLCRSTDGGLTFAPCGYGWCTLGSHIALHPDFAANPVIYAGEDGLPGLFSFRFGPRQKARVSKPRVFSATNSSGKRIFVQCSVAPAHPWVGDYQLPGAYRLTLRLYRYSSGRYRLYRTYNLKDYDDSYEREIPWRALSVGKYYAQASHQCPGELGHLLSLSKRTYFTRASHFSYWTRR